MRIECTVKPQHIVQRLNKLEIWLQPKATLTRFVQGA